MRELFSAFGSEVFRPLVTIFIPGMISISTWFIGLALSNESFGNLVNGNHTETAFLLMILGLFVGLLLDDMGGSYEKHILDKRVAKPPGYEKHEDEWFEWLRTGFRVEPIGQRYLRDLVWHLKFELGASFGLVFGAVGLVVVPLSIATGLPVFVLMVGAAGYLLFYEAPQTVKALSRVRRELLKGVILSPRETM